MKNTTIIGSILSLLWAGFFVAVIYYKRATLDQLSLNELGDFFAGFAAPLALIWLVLGYLQQGEELRLNTEALKAQQTELQKQVEETKALAKHAERQAKASEDMAHTASSQYMRQRVDRMRERHERNQKVNKDVS